MTRPQAPPPGPRGRPSPDFTGDHVRVENLAGQLSDLAQSLSDREVGDDILEAIVSAAVGTVPGAEYSSISAVAGRREVRTLASTGDLALEVDRAQYLAGEGPCLETLYAERTVRLPDLLTERRWPDFTRRARELGVRSMLAVQLFAVDDELGALNLHSTRPHAYESEQVALLFASHAAVALAASQERGHLQIALSFRDMIGMAKGILMERFAISGDEAFGLLSRQSQNSNHKLHDVAAEVVRSRESRPG